MAGSGEKARGGGCRRRCLGSLAAAPPLSRGQGEPRMRVLALDPEPGARRGGLREEARLRGRYSCCLPVTTPGEAYFSGPVQRPQT